MANGFKINREHYKRVKRMDYEKGGIGWLDL